MLLPVIWVREHRNLDREWYTGVPYWKRLLSRLSLLSLCKPSDINTPVPIIRIQTNRYSYSNPKYDSWNMYRADDLHGCAELNYLVHYYDMCWRHIMLL